MKRILFTLAAVLAVPAQAAPSPEAIELGKQLAATGSLSRLFPLLVEKEIQEILVSNPDLTNDDQVTLRRIAAEVLADGQDRIFAAQGTAYAENLTVEDMRELLKRNKDPVSARYNDALPAAIMAAVTAMSGYDFKGEVLTKHCRATGKTCASVD